MSLQNDATLHLLTFEVGTARRAVRSKADTGFALCLCSHGQSLLPTRTGKLHRFCTISAPKTALFRNRPLSLNKLQPAGVKMVQFYPTNILDREKTRHFGQETVKFLHLCQPLTQIARSSR
jgi:hypothetical protein